MTDDAQQPTRPVFQRLGLALIRWVLIAIIIIAIGIIIYGLLPAERQQQVRDIQQDLQEEIDERVVPKAQSVIDTLQGVNEDTDKP